MSKPTLDNLFGSKVRVKILKFMYRNYPADFTLREITQRVQETYDDTKKELGLLKELRIIKKKSHDKN
jgi:predicted transcriptional regulator with HTH domain